MPLAGVEPAILENERPQTYALDRAATGICTKILKMNSKALQKEVQSTTTLQLNCIKLRLLTRETPNVIRIKSYSFLSPLFNTSVKRTYSNNIIHKKNLGSNQVKCFLKYRRATYFNHNLLYLANKRQ